MKKVEKLCKIHYKTERKKHIDLLIFPLKRSGCVFKKLNSLLFIKKHITVMKGKNRGMGKEVAGRCQRATRCSNVNIRQGVLSTDGDDEEHYGLIKGIICEDLVLKCTERQNS